MLGFVLCPRTWDILVNGPCVLEENMVCTVVSWMFYVCQLDPVVDCVVQFYILADLLLVLSTSESGVEVPNFNWGFVLWLHQFLLRVFEAQLLDVHRFRIVFFLVNWLFYHDVMSLFVSSNVIVLKCTLMLIWHFMCFLKLMFAWYNVFYPSIFIQLMSLYLKWVSFRNHMVGSWFFFFFLVCFNLLHQFWYFNLCI